MINSGALRSISYQHQYCVLHMYCRRSRIVFIFDSIRKKEKEKIGENSIHTNPFTIHICSLSHRFSLIIAVLRVGSISDLNIHESSLSQFLVERDKKKKKSYKRIAFHIWFWFSNFHISSFNVCVALVGLNFVDLISKKGKHKSSG